MLAPALLVALALPAAAPPAPAYVLEAADVRRVEATLTYAVHCDKLKATEWVVFAAAAPELPGQAKVKSRLEPGGAAAKEASALGRAVLCARVPVEDKELEDGIPIRVVYEATLRSRKLKPLAAGARPPKVEPLTDKERGAALGEAGEIDYKAEKFQAWLKERGLRPEKGEADLDFARRAFREVRGHFRYEFKAGMDRHASAVCRAGRSDCGGLSGLFVAALRAGGVPARCLYGRWATSAEKGARVGDVPYYQAHVKAEFYADGIGWVPVDLASGVLHDKSKEGLRFFGDDAGDFLTFHIDPSLELDTGAFGKQKVNTLQVPAFWATSSVMSDAPTIKEAWEVKKVR